MAVIRAGPMPAAVGRTSGSSDWPPGKLERGRGLVRGPPNSHHVCDEQGGLAFAAEGRIAAPFSGGLVRDTGLRAGHVRCSRESPGRTCLALSSTIVLTSCRAAEPSSTRSAPCTFTCPTLCHDDRLAPSGVCRSCLVKVTGSAGWFLRARHRSLTVWKIETNGPELEEHRRSIIEALAREYPSGTVIAFLRRSSIGRCEFGACSGTSRDDAPIGVSKTDRIRTSRSTCRGASTAIAACASATSSRASSSGTSGTVARDTRIEPDGPTLRESSCVELRRVRRYLSDRRAGGCGPHRRCELPSTWTRTTCPYCGVGCEMTSARARAASCRSRPCSTHP